MKKRVLSMFMALVLCLTLLPAPVRAEETVCICTDRCSEEMVNLDCPICSAENADLSACLGKEADLPLMAAAASTEETISGNVTWENRNITTPVVVKGDTTITLKGENTITITETAYTAALDMYSANLTIQGSGSLTVNVPKGKGSIADGNCSDTAGGTLTIKDGAKITTNGGLYGLSAKTIVIESGNLNLNSGWGINTASLTINGGTLYATGKYGAISNSRYGNARNINNNLTILYSESQNANTDDMSVGTATDTTREEEVKTIYIAKMAPRANLTVGAQQGTLQEGSGNQTATFSVTGSNVKINTLNVDWEGAHTGLTAEKSADNQTITVTADNNVKEGRYKLKLTADSEAGYSPNKATATATVTVAAAPRNPITINKQTEVVYEKLGGESVAVVDVNASLESGQSGKITYQWYVNGKEFTGTGSGSYKIILTQSDLTPVEGRNWEYSGPVYCKLSYNDYTVNTDTVAVTVNTCTHEKYTNEGKCQQCGEPCRAEALFISEDGIPYSFERNNDGSQVGGILVSGGTFYFVRDTDVILRAGTSGGDGTNKKDVTLDLQGHEVSTLDLKNCPYNSVTIKNGTIKDIQTTAPTVLILDSVKTEQDVFYGYFTLTVKGNCVFDRQVVFTGKTQLQGGTFPCGINVEPGEQALALLADGYAFADADTNEILNVSHVNLQGQNSNVIVVKIPLTINPEAETLWYYNSAEHSLQMNAQPTTAGNDITYEWYDGDTKLECDSDTYTIPKTMPAGSYTYTCKATCDGYTLSHDFTFTVEECKHEGVEITFNSNGFGNCPKCNATVYQPAVETTDKYDIDDDGTKDTVYEISNAGQLYWFAGLVNGTLDGVEQNTLANAILTANITVNENLLDSLQYDTEGNVSNGSDFISWTPIADWMVNRTTQYSGTFDGNNKTVSGLYFNGDSTCIGLFGSSESDGNIKNVGVVDSYFKGNDHVGGVCGNNAGTITNCYNAGNLTAIESSATIGGICGYNNGGTIANCYNTGTVTATGPAASVGGVCGSSTELISNCYNIGTVTAASSDADISGICGYNFGPVKNCYYLADTEDENGGKTAAQFASGEVAYLLSQGCTIGEGDDAETYDGSIWGQALEGDNSDKYPKLYTDGSNKVYHIVTKYKTCDHDPNPSSYTDESRILEETYANNQTTPAFENKGFTWTLNEDKTQHVCSVCGQEYDHANVYSADADNHKITAKCYYDESENRGSLTISTPTVSGGLTEIFYDGSPKEAVVTNDFSEVKPEIEVTYTYQAADSNETKTLTKDEKPTAAGNYTASVSLTGADKKTATVSVSYEIKKATPTLTWADNATEKTITYTGQEITANDLPAVTVGLQNDKTFSGTINYSYVKKTDGTSDSIPTSGLPTDVGIYEVTAFIPDSDNYIGSTSNVLTLTITKASNDFTTALSCSDHTYAKDETPKPNATAKFGTVTYKYAKADSDGNAPAVDSAYTDIIPVNAGTYAVKAYVAETDNYAGLTSDPVVFTINKAASPNIGDEEKSYSYTAGSDGKAISVDIARKLPTDRGTTTYAVAMTDTEQLLSEVTVDTAGNLTYKVNQVDSSKVGKTAIITVTASMENYANAGYTLTISITDKKAVEIKGGNSVSVDGSNVLIYGEKISKLTLGNTVFVEAGTDDVIEGILSWSNPDEIPAAGTTQAGWVFRPADSKHYEELTGTAAITVAKATPIVVTVPTVAEREYNPDAALTGPDMTGGSVTGADGNEIAGIWSFTGTNIVPTVNNKGYQAVFTPNDTNNYNTVTGTITVKVTKATPVIAEKPTAGALTYGQKLSDSTLTGGKAAYQTADGTEITGAFAWKNSSIKPTAADSQKTEYDVTFTPSDKDNYNAVDTKLALTVNKAAQAPNMPQAAMAPAHSTKKVGDITLPDGWNWQEADKDTALADGVAVTANAIYTGTDKGNYETESVSITITRSKCDHTHTEIRNQREATCKKEGYTGDTYCKDCGEKLATGTATVKKAHTVGTPATCVSKAVCSVCSETFGEVDATNHVHTTVKNRKEATCTQTGYAGDTYCTDCDKLLSTGKELAALGHDYKATVTKQPTTTEEGIRTYTCTRCNSSYTESIAKLPEEQHTHNYTGSITKEATCTEAGVRTYTCSCGDSYTENIPATGHSYVSKVTKAATTTEEGIMTYTCSKCGHSYTQPIAMIKSDNSNKDNGKDNGTSIKPYIKDDSGKEGWDVIKPQLEEAKSGDTVTVAMNGTTVVPKDVIDSIKGKDTTLVLDMGNGLSWKIYGKDITDAAGDIDFDVTVGADAGKSIPVDVINNVTGERSSLNLTLAYDGEFGFTATLTVNMESKNAGLYANLFYYNEQTGELEFISAGQIDPDGNVELVFTHASDYTIVVDAKIMSDNGQADNKADETIPAPKTGDSISKYAWNNTIIIIIDICIILIVFGAAFCVRKKSGSEEE